MLADGSTMLVTLTEMISPEATLLLTLILPGDYNQDGIVDGQDYTVWSTTYGTDVSTPGQGADGNFDGHVDASDYTVWRDQLGEAFGTISISVPEPTTIWMLGITIGMVCLSMGRCILRSYP